MWYLFSWNCYCKYGLLAFVFLFWSCLRWNSMNSSGSRRVQLYVLSKLSLSGLSICFGILSLQCGVLHDWAVKCRKTREQLQARWAVCCIFFSFLLLLFSFSSIGLFATRLPQAILSLLLQFIATCCTIFAAGVVAVSLWIWAVLNCLSIKNHSAVFTRNWYEKLLNLAKTYIKLEREEKKKKPIKGNITFACTH